MTKNVLILIISCLSFEVTAQDLLVTVQGDSVEIKVETVEDKEISYKYWDHVDGPSYISKTKNIHKIIYENGREENYNKLDEDEGSILDNALDAFGSISFKRNKDNDQDSVDVGQEEDSYVASDTSASEKKSFLSSFGKKDKSIESDSLSEGDSEVKTGFFAGFGKGKSTEGTPMVDDFEEEIQIFNSWYAIDPSLPSSTSFNPGATQVWNKYFAAIGNEWADVLDPSIIENLKVQKFKGHYEDDRDLTTLQVEELDFWDAYTDFHNRKEKMYEEITQKIGDPKRHVFLNNETVFNIWYTYKVTKQDSETRSSGKIDYDEKFEITVYAQNTGDKPYSFAEESNVVKLDLKHYIELGLGPVAKTKSDGAIVIQPGDYVSHTRTHTTDPERGYVGHPIVNNWVQPNTYPEDLYDPSWSTEQRNAEIENAKNIDSDVKSQSKRAKSELDWLGRTARDIAERNQKVDPEPTPGTSKIVIYYSSNPLYDDPLMDLSLKSEIFVNGQFISQIKKRDRIEIILDQPGDYKLLVQKQKGKEYQYCGKLVSVGSDETHYYRMKRVDKTIEGSMFPKSVPQFYNVTPGLAKDELANQELTGNNEMVSFTF